MRPGRSRVQTFSDLGGHDEEPGPVLPGTGGAMAGVSWGGAGPDLCSHMEGEWGRDKGAGTRKEAPRQEGWGLGGEGDSRGKPRAPQRGKVPVQSQSKRGWGGLQSDAPAHSLGVVHVNAQRCANLCVYLGGLLYV